MHVSEGVCQRGAPSDEWDVRMCTHLDAACRCAWLAVPDAPVVKRALVVSRRLCDPIVWMWHLRSEERTRDDAHGGKLEQIGKHETTTSFESNPEAKPGAFASQYTAMRARPALAHATASL